jgi:hypothetical protein
MIETLILGIAIGVLGTLVGAAYAAYKWNKNPFVLKKFDSGYTVLACEPGFGGDPDGYIGLKKDNKLIAGIRYNNSGTIDVVI